MNNFTLLLLLTFSVLQVAKGQNPGYFQYGLSSNLPSQEVYELFQDTKGYVWALTDKGIHRFNGTSFEEITCNPVLENSLPLDILEDKNGDIKILFLEGQIGCFNAQTEIIESHPMNKEVRAVLQTSKYYQGVLNNSFHALKDNALLFSFYHMGYFIVYPDSIIHKTGFEKSYNFIQKEEDVLFYVQSDSIGPSIEADPILRYSILDKKDSIVIPNGQHCISAGHRPFVYQGLTTNYIVDGNRLMRLENNTMHEIRYFQFDILGLFELNENELLIFLNGRGAEKIDSKSLKTIEISYLPFKYITFCIKDNEGGFWFSTLFNGIIHIPYPEFSKFESLKGMQITALKWHQQKLYYGTLQGEVGYLSKGNCIKIAELKSGGIRGFPILKDKLHCIADKAIFIFQDYDQLNENPLLVYDLFPRDYLVKNDTLFLGKSNGINYLVDSKIYAGDQPIINNDGSYETIKTLNDFFRVQSVCFWKNQFLISNNTTILTINPTKGLAYRDTLFTFDSNILLLNKNDDGTLLYVVTKKGLYVLDAFTATPFMIFETNNCRISELLCINNKIWLGTNIGLYTLELNSHSKRLETNYFQLSESKDESNIQEMEMANDTLYIATAFNLIQVPIAKLTPDTSKIILYLHKIENRGKSVNKERFGNFNYNENGFTFWLDLLTSKNRSAISIFYRLAAEDPWKKTSETKITFPFLPPNAYQFQVKACSARGCSEIQYYNFSISPPLWQRTEVKLILGLLLAFSILFIYRMRVRKIKNKRDIDEKIRTLENRANELRQQALKAQMNPHFLFNALSSIQSFILANDVVSSEKYLVDFSRLMRLILESSAAEFIPLEKEITLLSAYLNLEQLRFNFRFQFTLNCDENLMNEGLKIPAMILQPFVENAIIHGVKNQEQGKITVNFTPFQDSIMCTIIDNGAGFSTSHFDKDKNRHESRATAIIAERLTLLKTKYKQTTITVIDNAKIGGEGVLVQIILPLK